MNQKRQPKGTTIGGQFAPDLNPESTVVLGAGVTASRANATARLQRLTVARDDPRDVIYDAQENVDLILGRYESRETFLNSDARELVDSMTTIVDTQKQIIDAQRKELEALRKDRDEDPSLDEIVLSRARGRLGDEDETANVDPARLAAEYKRYSLRMHDRDYDGVFEGIDYVVEQFLDWRESEIAKHADHEAPFQIGSVLEYDVEVVPWVTGMHEENVAVQVWMHEWGDADNDCAGWEPRAIAQIARERGITNVTNRDLQDILDDPDISKIAFRPDTSIARLLKQINALNKDGSTS
jgi:hypothetical protein